MDGDATIVDAVERTFSGELVYLPGEDLFAAVHATAASGNDAARARLGGCLGSSQTALDPAVPSFPIVTHTLTGCSVRGRTVEGTVTSRWSVVDGLEVTHQSTGLTIDGRETDVALGVEIYFTGDLETRRRTLRAVTSNPAGEAVSIEGTWLATYDLPTGCGTRDGSVSATVGQRSVRRGDRALAWCTTESLELLTAGTLELGRQGSPEPLRVTFLGDDRLAIERSDGARFDATVSELTD
jgi:hypothetical protein